MASQREINSIMTDKQRKSIVRKCKKQASWNDFESGAREVNQDKILEKECIAIGYTYSEFCHCDGKILEKLLS